MTKSNEILEALKMQPLTEEEKARRHILGRWYGPIATCNESTRNGRRYNRELWEKALNDELFHEKIANKCLFLELGHPIDREETDMSKVCACIPEMPKIIDGDLCACVDILDTPNGRILKTLCDYGFVPGVSSRGSGDVMPNDDVDPETFFLETFDCVAIPAVKKARLSMCESLDKNAAKLKKALTESFNKASEEDKAIMKETLENLDIDIESGETEEEPVKKVLTAEDIPWADDEEEILVEEPSADVDESLLGTALVAGASGLAGSLIGNALSEKTVSQAAGKDENLTEEATSDVDESLIGTALAAGAGSLIGKAVGNALSEDTEDQSDNDTEADTEEETEEEAEEEVEEDTSEEKLIDINSTESVDMNTVGDAIKLLQEYDEDTRVELEPVEINGEEYELDSFTSFIDDEDKDDPILVLGVHCTETDTDEESDGADSNIEAQSDDEETSVETIEEVDEDDIDSADDDGEVDVIESLKEMIRQKEALEIEVSDLRKAKAVGDAKVEELQEKLTRYRTAFKNTSAEAAKVPELQSKAKELQEQLAKSNNTIRTLTEKVNKTQQLKESAESGKATITKLNEQVSSLTRKTESLEAKLEGQTKQYTNKLQERTNLAKAYKARFLETLTKYVESKANMLGVQPSEITSRLNESYTLADVDAVCDQILDSTVNFSRLPFSGRPKTSARIITESTAKQVNRDPAYGYEIDDDLLELAGLKK